MMPQNILNPGIVTIMQKAENSEEFVVIHRDMISSRFDANEL